MPFYSVCDHIVSHNLVNASFIKKKKSLKMCLVLCRFCFLSLAIYLLSFGGTSVPLREMATNRKGNG